MPHVSRALALCLIALASTPVAQAQQIFVTGTNSNDIWVMNQDGSGAPSLLYAYAGPGPAGPVGIQVTPSRELYWGNGNNWVIYHAPADGNGVPAELPVVPTCCEHHDVAVDETNDRIFFTAQSGGLWIDSLSAPGAGSSLTGTVATSVVYDRAADVLYFSGLGNGIFSINPDGSGQTLLYTAFGSRGIAHDPTTGTLYWIDRDLGSLMTAPDDGSGVATELFPANGGYAVDVDPYRGRVYWTEFTAGERVMAGTLDGQQGPFTLFQNFGVTSLRGISVGGGPDLQITGTCNNPGTVDITGVTPGGSFAAVRGPDVNGSIIPAGPCAGGILDLGSPGLIKIVNADANGELHLTPTLPGSLCGQHVQLVDLTTCATSNTQGPL